MINNTLVEIDTFPYRGYIITVLRDETISPVRFTYRVKRRGDAIRLRSKKDFGLQAAASLAAKERVDKIINHRSWHKDKR